MPDNAATVSTDSTSEDERDQGAEPQHHADGGQDRSKGSTERHRDRNTSRREGAAAKSTASDDDSDSEETTGQDESGSSSKRFTQAELDQKIADRLKREQAKFSDYGDLKKAADELRKLKDAEKSESQRLADQLADAEVRLRQYEVEKVRNEAGAEAGLPPDMWEYITASDPDEALGQARKLAERVAPPTPKPGKTEQGARTPPRSAPTPNDLLRGMAGHS